MGMSEEIKPIQPVTEADNENNNSIGSTIFGVSLRGIIALLIILTICGMSAFGRPVVEPLYSNALTVLAYYYGHIHGSQTK